ncbi:alpha/beta hydrolase [Marinifilum sp. D737]|uniref:alpha/beta hydrolase n=1 Tax=Marinifilum sp. D737 TaxID=2969628 RepID=UPI002276399C|nr:alpha/beta hydrolase-fold protein [Marinifilum sp. D737]MCY1636349.1 alpha/beta hydrolase-fold protein [Marinifilum sp. D737]
MIKLTSLFIIIILSSGSLFSQLKIESIPNGKVMEFESKILNENKRVFVHFPNDYKTKSYPTIYLISSTPNDFRSAICQGEFIVIGIENNDPKKCFTGKYNRDDYLNFLKKELIPFVKTNYNSSPIKFISGHSISGGFVMDIFSRLPNSFSFYIATSPTIHMLDSTVIKTDFSKQRYLYFNIGSRENYEQLEKANNCLYDTLDSLKIKNLNWKYEVLTDETHETNEYTGFCRAYNFYKSFSTIPDSLLNENIHLIVEYINELNSQLGNKIEIGESVFMPNLLINLNAGNYDNVLDVIEFIAQKDTDFFNEESEIIIDIADELRNKGKDTFARKAYQLIFDETKNEIILEKIKELDKKE